MLNKGYVAEIYTYEYTGPSHVQEYNFFFYQIGIKNTSATGKLKVYFDRYNTESFYYVEPSSYVELPIVSNWFRYEFVSGTPAPVQVTVFTFSQGDYLVPRFPNLYIEDPNNPGNYYQYNPLNQDGFFTETWNYGNSPGYLPYNSESIIEVDYWIMGHKVPATSPTFKQDIFNALITYFIQATYPTSSVNEVLSILPGGQESEIITKVKNYLFSLDAPLNDEYFGGWAKLVWYDRKLALLAYNLSAGDKLYLPFPVLGYTVKNTGSANATLTVKLGGPSGTLVRNITLTPGSENYYHLEEMDYIEVTGGTVEVKLHGNLAKLISFAPIVNIYYPFGFDESTGQPTQSYATFQNELAKFENDLANALFTGRVIKYKWVVHEPQNIQVWDADYYHQTYMEPKWKLPFEEIRPYLRDWYVYRKYEEDLINRIYEDNPTAFAKKPQSLEDVINNNSATLILWQDFSSVPPANRPAAKKEFILKLLLEEYLGQYGRGYLSYGSGIYN